MILNRRQVLHSGVGVVALGVLGKQDLDRRLEGLREADQADHHEIVGKLRSQILNYASSLECDFVDVRFSYRRKMDVKLLTGFKVEAELFMGVRVLVNGYWGYSSVPIWNAKQAENIVDLAYNQARGNSSGLNREVDILAYSQPGIKGEWVMPIKHDPFERNPYEFVDYIWAAFDFVNRFPVQTDLHSHAMEFEMLDSWYGATNGAEQYQRLYTSSGKLGYRVRKGNFSRFDIEIPKSGLGYEVFTDSPHFETLRKGLDETLELCMLPLDPVDVGRYPMVLDGMGTARLIGTTVIGAVELDRILGYEANAAGTSYIQDLDSDVGTFRIGSDILNIDCNRSRAGGVATRLWDDEGTPVESDTLVSKGVLQKVLSNKELASYSAEKVIGGNSIALDASYPPLVRAGNIEVHGDGTNSLGEMFASLERGYFFRKPTCGVDFQFMSGMLSGDVYEIRKGKLVAKVNGAGCWFRTPELLDNLVSLGDESTVHEVSQDFAKGEPATRVPFSVNAPGAMFSEAAIIDANRK